MDLDDYQQRSAATDLEGDASDPIMPLLGLAGEVGSLLAEFKKKRRPDGHAYTGFDEVVETELGDILWYLAALARRVDVPLSQAGTDEPRQDPGTVAERARSAASCVRRGIS